MECAFHVNYIFCFSIRICNTRVCGWQGETFVPESGKEKDANSVKVHSSSLYIKQESIGP